MEYGGDTIRLSRDNAGDRESTMSVRRQENTLRHERVLKMLIMQQWVALCIGSFQFIRNLQKETVWPISGESLCQISKYPPYVQPFSSQTRFTMVTTIQISGTKTGKVDTGQFSASEIAVGTFKMAEQKYPEFTSSTKKNQSNKYIAAFGDSEKGGILQIRNRG